MNKEQVFNEFARYAEADNQYYTWGMHGIIEEVLSWFNIPSEKFLGANSVVHANNLEKLHEFIVSQASDEQLKQIYGLTKGAKLPEYSPIADASGKVFVSMPMNVSKCADVEAIRSGIANALADTDNVAYFLDKDVHNDNIFYKMLEEITSCRFLVADLTSQNTGVYYEAGYAKALGKTVILTCKSTDFENVHFDIKQTQIVVWSDEKDLRNKLTNHIRKSKIGGESNGGTKGKI